MVCIMMRVLSCPSQSPIIACRQDLFYSYCVYSRSFDFSKRLILHSSEFRFNPLLVLSCFLIHLNPFITHVYGIRYNNATIFV